MARAKKANAGHGSGAGGVKAIVAIVAVAAVAGLGYAVMGDRARAATEPVELEGMEDIRALVELAQGVTIGPSDAPSKLIVFSDYQCPWCGQFASRVKPLLEANEVKEGKVQIVFYDFPLGGGHKHSFVAARAARCAGEQGKYWEYHDVLFGQQSRWSAQASTPFSSLEEYADQVGVERGAFDACLYSDRYADVVTANRLLGEQLGVNSTPTVIVNNQRVRAALDYRAISELIAQEPGA